VKGCREPPRPPGECGYNFAVHPQHPGKSNVKDS
jgi:hypothetical protein